MISKIDVLITLCPADRERESELPAACALGCAEKSSQARQAQNTLTRCAGPEKVHRKDLIIRRFNQSSLCVGALAMCCMFSHDQSRSNAFPSKNRNPAKTEKLDFFGTKSGLVSVVQNQEIILKKREMASSGWFVWFFWFPNIRPSLRSGNIATYSFHEELCRFQPVMYKLSLNRDWLKYSPNK